MEDQATDRAFRIGQRRNVQVHKFVHRHARGDDRPDDRTQEGPAESVVGEGWITEFSDEDLREMVALRREAYG